MISIRTLAVVAGVVLMVRADVFNWQIGKTEFKVTIQIHTHTLYSVAFRVASLSTCSHYLPISLLSLNGFSLVFVRVCVSLIFAYDSVLVIACASLATRSHRLADLLSTFASSV